MLCEKERWCVTKMVCMYVRAYVRMYMPKPTCQHHEYKVIYGTRTTASALGHGQTFGWSCIGRAIVSSLVARDRCTSPWQSRINAIRQRILRKELPSCDVFPHIIAAPVLCRLHVPVDLKLQPDQRPVREKCSATQARQGLLMPSSAVALSGMWFDGSMDNENGVETSSCHQQLSASEASLSSLRRGIVNSRICDTHQNVVRLDAQDITSSRVVTLVFAILTNVMPGNALCWWESLGSAAVES